jgi:Malectin domain/IPT/TIG domain
MNLYLLLLLLLLLLLTTSSYVEAAILFATSFQNDTESFIYQDNAFRNTVQQNYASGRYNSGLGALGNLQVNLGGIDNKTILGMSAGWRRDFTLPQAASVVINMNYRMSMSADYDDDEYLQTLCSIDGVLVGSTIGVDYVAQVFGNEVTNSTSFWIKLRPITLPAGTHRLIVGAYNNKKTTATKRGIVYVSNVQLIYQVLLPPVKAPVRPPVSAPIFDPFTLRINVGSNQNYSDPNGNNWVADTYFGNKGKMFSGCPLAIAGTVMDEIYCKERFFNTRTTPVPYQYTIPVPRSATYSIRLHFAEIYFKTLGKRVFSVWVNGQQVMDALDIQSEVGFATALIVPVQTKVVSGSVTIELVPIVEHPKICGIEVIENLPTTTPVRPPIRPTKAPTKAPAKASTKAPVKLPTKAPVDAPTKAPVKAPVPPPVQVPSVTPSSFELRINAGSQTDYVDPSGITWEADKYFGNKGGVYSLCPLAIAGTAMDDLYCKERYFNIWEHSQPFQYNIPVPRQAVYSVRMHFAEIVYKGVGQRVFEVWVNGRQIMAALDIFAEVGYAKSFILSVDAQVTGDKVTIEFAPNKENPKISGIEVIEIPDYVPPPTLAPVTAPFNLLINCGGVGFVESSGVRQWVADQYFIGGSTYVDGSSDINGTLDDALYQSERNGEFKYEIPVPTGSYEVVLHFAELYWNEAGKRWFDIQLEDNFIFTNVDLVALGGGKRYQAITLESVAIVSDGFLSLEIQDSKPKVDMPKLSGIEINFLQPHLAHSVSNGPYISTDIFNVGSAITQVDGSYSHSHGTGLEVVQWTWKEGNTVVGVGPTPNITLPVGEHTISLSIKDNDNNEATDTTTLTVRPFGFPAALSVTPSSGSIAGGQSVTIKGSGFTYSPSQTKVKFGLVVLSGSAITIVDQFTIRLRTPSTVIGSPVSITVETPLAVSNAITYTYEASSRITFTSDVLTLGVAAPCSVAFGPDGRLYIGTLYGKLARLTLDDTFTKVISSVIADVAPFRAILGIAFDPLQADGLSDVYITTSFFFHGESKSSSGQSINGSIKKVSGANLDTVINIVTGLPVSDHDHGKLGRNIIHSSCGTIYSDSFFKIISTIYRSHRVGIW